MNSNQFSLRLPVTGIKPCKNRFADVKATYHGLMHLGRYAFSRTSQRSAKSWTELLPRSYPQSPSVFPLCACLHHGCSHRHAPDSKNLSLLCHSTYDIAMPVRRKVIHFFHHHIVLILYVGIFASLVTITRFSIAACAMMSLSNGSPCI